MPLLPWKTETYWTPLDPDEVRGRLVDLYSGRVQDDDTFWVRVPISSGRNSWRPYIEGELTGANGGTLLQVRFPMNLFILLFTFFHGIPFLGLTWLIGLGAYLWGIGQVKAPFEESLDISLTGTEARRHAAGQAVADPEAEGAAAAAPVVFRARAGVDGASFRLGRGTLEVRGGGIRYGDEDLRWDDVRIVAAKGRRLVVLREDGSPLELPCGDARPEEIQWLATYLQARNRRWTTPEERREAEARARARLKQMVR